VVFFTGRDTVLLSQLEGGEVGAPLVLDAALVVSAVALDRPLYGGQ
jgi:hypothetical protein